MVWYIHWNQSELAERLQALRSQGYTVSGHWEAGAPVHLMPPLPDALLISLDRLPSHGRAIARWFWEAEKRRSIPILFVGGSPEKLSRFQTQFPGAHFCAEGEISRVLADLSIPAHS